MPKSGQRERWHGRLAGEAGSRLAAFGVMEAKRGRCKEDGVPEEFVSAGGQAIALPSTWMVCLVGLHLLLDPLGCLQRGRARRALTTSSLETKGL